MKYARVTVDTNGRITQDSTLTLDDKTVPIPEQVPLGKGDHYSCAAPHRIGRVLVDEFGYKFASDFRDNIIDRKAAGYQLIPVEELME